MLAIEAQFGEPLINTDLIIADQGEKNHSQWAMFYEAVAHKKKFAKLKDCINISMKSKASIAKD